MNKSILISLVILTWIFSGCIRKNEPHRIKEKQDSLIVQKNEVRPTPNEFLFVGTIKGKAGLYKYNLLNESYSEYWYNEKEEVVDFSSSDDKKAGFLLTAFQLGKKGVFPFIEKAKLYFINQDFSFPKFIDNIGSGLQVFSFWQSDSSFIVILNVIDLKVGTYVDQFTRTYDKYGNKLNEVKKRYILASDGFPPTPIAPKKLSSPDKKFSLLFVDSIQTEIYLIDKASKDKKVFITKVSQKVNYVEWSADHKFLIFSTIDISPMNETLYDRQPNTSKILVYSLLDRKIVKSFGGGGIKNFLLNDGLLIYDNGFKEKSQIFIYNFQTSKLTDTISVAGGCGLKNIPIIPDYGA